MSTLSIDYQLVHIGRYIHVLLKDLSRTPNRQKSILKRTSIFVPMFEISEEFKQSNLNTCLLVPNQRCYVYTALILFVFLNLFK
jgi:hypothetical protein